MFVPFEIVYKPAWLGLFHSCLARTALSVQRCPGIALHMSLLALPAPPPTKHSLQSAEDRRPAASNDTFKMDRTAVVILRFLQGVAALTNLVLSSLGRLPPA